jgi:hypothetical protein
MGSPNYYDVTVSREAGVFKGHVHVNAESKTEAKQKALKIAKAKWNNKDFWTYDEIYFNIMKKPLIQVEEVEIE